MLSPRRTLQILVPNPPMVGSPIQRVLPDIDQKLKTVLMALEIERLHRVAIHITDKYNDKIEQLLTTQQILNDKIENQETQIGKLNQQLLEKDDIINDIFEEKSPDEMNKKLVQQLKQVTNQLNRAKKQIETLNEMNIIFKRNPPESPELIDRIKQLEIDYEIMLQKKEQEITFLKIRNSSYDHSDNDQPDLHKLQYENQLLNDKIQVLQNEKKNHSRHSSFRDSSPPVRLITRVIQQEPFNAFSDFQLLHSRPSSFHISPQPKRTPKQNAPEFETNLRKLQQLQNIDQFTADSVLQQIRLIATLLHLKRMELPDDLKDTKVTYLNQIETTDAKQESKPDLASTVKPKKLFTFDDGENTEEKQQRSQSIRSNISKPLTKNQFIQVDFYDRKLLEKAKGDFNEMKKNYNQIEKNYNEMKGDYEQLQKLLKQATNESHQKAINIFDYDDEEEQQNILNPNVVDNSCQVSLSQLRDIKAENDISQIQIMQQEKVNIDLKSQNTLYYSNNLSNNFDKQQKNLYEEEFIDDQQNNKQSKDDNQNLTLLQQKLLDLEKENLNLQVVQQQFHELESKNKEQLAEIKDLISENCILQNQLNYLSDELNKQTEQQGDQTQQQDDQTKQLEHLMQITKDELKQKHIDLEQLQIQNEQLLKDFNHLNLEKENQQKNLEIQLEQIKQENQQLLQQAANLKLDNRNKSRLLDELQMQNQKNQQLVQQLGQENQHYEQVLKDQEMEYENQLSQIRFRISVLEEQKIKEHSVNISQNDDKKQSDYSINNSTEIKRNAELEAQVRKLSDEKYVLFDQMQKQTADYKSKIDKLTEEYDFQKLQLEEKIKELEKRIVVYIDGDEKLMIENQNLANQIMNLTNQLSQSRQKILNTKTKEQSPRNQNDSMNQQVKEKDQLIVQLQKNYENLQVELESVTLEKAELANQMQELQSEVVDAANQQYNYNQEIAEIRQQNQELKLQLQSVNRQQDQQKKLKKIELETVIPLDQQKKIETKSQATQFDTAIIYIDQKVLKEKDDIIYALKKQFQIKEIELQQAYDNIRVANFDYTRLEDQLKKQKAAYNQEIKNRNIQERQYQQSALYQTRQNRILTQSSNIRCSNSEEHRKATSQSKSQEKLWKQKYEKVLQEMYQKETSSSQVQQKYDELLLKFNTMKSNLDLTEELNTRLKQIVDQLQISLIETKSSINSSQNHESCLKREQSLQQDVQRSKQQLEQYQIEMTELKNRQQQSQAQPQNQDIITNLKQRIFYLEIETQKLCKQIIEKDEQLKQYVKQSYQLEQLRLENQGLVQQIEQYKFQNQQLQEKERQAYAFQLQQQQQLISELDGKCHALLTELNELKGEYQRFSYKFSSNQISKQGNSFNISNRLEIMNNLDVIRQELKTYQQKCSIQENELTQLRLQLQQPYQSQQLQKKVVNVRSYREQDEYLTEIISDLEVTKSQNENLRKLNAELQEQQTSLLKEIDKIKKQLGVFSPKGQQPTSPRIEENLYSPRNNRMKDSNGKQTQIEQLRNELDALKQQVFSTSSSHCIKEAEKLSLQARVLTLEQQMKNVQNSLEKIQLLTQENQDLRIQVRMLKETNSRMQQIVIQKSQPNDLTQVERLNRELTEKISELTQLKIKYKQALSTVQRMENRLM